MEQQYPRRNLTHWIDEQLGDHRIRRVLCLFSGTATQALAFKRRGVQVHAWDPLLSHRCWAKALVENNRRIVPPELSSSWLHLIKDPRVAKRFSPWATKYFTPEETIWLGIWRAHLDQTEDPTYRVLGELAVLWTMHYWFSLNDQSFEYKPLIPVAAFRHYLGVVNGMVFDNHAENRALEEPFGEEYDLLYCYLPGPPRPIERLWEGWLRGDPDFSFPEAVPGIEGFLLQAESIPTWAVAFNDHQVDREAFARTLSGMREVIGQKEIALPYPSASGSGIIRETFLVTARGGR